MYAITSSISSRSVLRPECIHPKTATTFQLLLLASILPSFSWSSSVSPSACLTLLARGWIMQFSCSALCIGVNKPEGICGAGVAVLLVNYYHSTAAYHHFVFMLPQVK